MLKRPLLKRLMATAALTVVLVAPACGDEETAIDRVEVVPMKLHVTMTGYLNVDFRETVDSHLIVRRFKAKEIQDAQVVGTEPVEPVRYQGGAFLTGVAILPYDGDGTYTIPPGSFTDGAGQSTQTGTSAASSIKLDWWPDGNVTADPESFSRRVKPCEVVVKNDGAEGTVTCPDVTDEASTKHVALTMRWEAPRKAKGK